MVDEPLDMLVDEPLDELVDRLLNELLVIVPGKLRQEHTEESFEVYTPPLHQDVKPAGGAVWVLKPPHTLDAVLECIEKT